MSSAPRPAVFAPSVSVLTEVFCAPSRAAAEKVKEEAKKKAEAAANGNAE